MSRGKKIWDVLTPVIVFLLCNVVASAVVASAVMAISGERTFAGIMEAVRSTALISTLLNFALVIVVQMFFRRYDNRRFGKDERIWPAWKIIIGVLIVSVAGVAGNYLIQVSGLEDIFTFYQKIENLTFSYQNPIILILTTVIIGPIAEELTFRGLVQRRARVWLKPGTAIVVSSLIFGLAHMNMIQLIYAFGIGLLLGYLYEKSGNLIAPILAHMAANAVTIAIF